MNNKGFTTVELVLTILLVVIIMATITNVTYVYRDRSDYEQTITEIINYKNTITRIIYDDILNSSNKVTKIVKNSDYSYTLVSNSKNYNLTINDESYSVGITYDDVFYEIPGSAEGLVSIDIDNVSFLSDEATGVYSLDIVFRHQNVEDVFRIHFVVS